ncbi:hypothetical protein GW17_00036361 [Ensete ventricosum]|nr:hypothetical protein GW17_00036361 [Ensete ventricosum]
MHLCSSFPSFRSSLESSSASFSSAASSVLISWTRNPLPPHRCLLRRRRLLSVAGVSRRRDAGEGRPVEDDKEVFEDDSSDPALFRYFCRLQAICCLWLYRFLIFYLFFIAMATGSPSRCLWSDTKMALLRGPHPVYMLLTACPRECAVGLGSFSGTSSAASAAAIRISCSEIMFLCSFIPGGSLGSSSSASRTRNWHTDPGNHLIFRLTDLPGIQASYSLLVFTWLSMRLLHLWLRFQSLSVLKFQTVRLFDNCIINMKRARLLVRSHVLHNTVPGTDRHCKFTSTCVKTLLKLYSKESYILYMKQHQGVSTFLVTFKVA